MIGMNGLESALARLEARREIAVFPLPNVVLFPHVSLGLHIFEPRYRRMIEDALATDRLIAMALLKEGWEQDYYGSPPVHDIACAGVIEEHHRLPDARFNIRLRGLSRIALGDFNATAPYRVATFRILGDLNSDDGPAVRPHRERLLLTCAGLLRDISGPPRDRWLSRRTCRSPWASTRSARACRRTRDAARRCSRPMTSSSAAGRSFRS
jgi:Lon protease-like protein